MGHIGDVDLQFVVAVFELPDVDGVVEIAGGFAVDRDYREVAVVAAVPQCVRGNYRFYRLRFFYHRRREAVGQVKLADHDLDVDSEVVLFAENLDYTAARALSGARPVGDFHVYGQAFQILPVGVDFGLIADDAVFVGS